MKRYSIIILIAIICIACNTKKKEKEISNQKVEQPQKALVQAEEELTKDVFKVEIELQSNYNDNIQLFYTESLEEHFSEERSIKRGYSKNDLKQKITFELPSGDYPFQFRFDIASNVKTEGIDVFNIIFSYNGSSLLLNKENYKDYLLINSDINLENETTLFKFMNTNENFDPQLTCSPSLVKAIYDL